MSWWLQQKSRASQEILLHEESPSITFLKMKGCPLTMNECPLKMNECPLKGTISKGKYHLPTIILQPANGYCFFFGSVSHTIHLWYISLRTWMVDFYGKLVCIIYQSHRAYRICAHWKNYRPDSPVRQSVKIFVDGSKGRTVLVGVFSHLKKHLHQIGCIFPNFRGEHSKTYLSCHRCQFRRAIPCDSVTYLFNLTKYISIRSISRAPGCNRHKWNDPGGDCCWVGG